MIQPWVGVGTALIPRGFYDTRRTGTGVGGRGNMMKTILALLLIAGWAQSSFVQAQAAPRPFTLTLSVEQEPSAGAEASCVVKAGSKIYLTIEKTNTSRHEMGCMRVTNCVTGLDPAYEFDVRYSNGNTVTKRVIDEGAMVGAFQGLGCKFKPGENSTSRGNEITRIYDLSQQSDYTIQISQPASDKRDAEVIKANTVKLTVTEDDSVIEKARRPF